MTIAIIYICNIVSEVDFLLFQSLTIGQLFRSDHLVVGIPRFPNFDHKRSSIFLFFIICLAVGSY
jgi:hypothetical protein